MPNFIAKVRVIVSKTALFFLIAPNCMRIDSYALKAGSEPTVFEFISKGPKGAIQKLILFQETDNPNLFNLAFGDKNIDTGDLNDLVVSNNGDTDKVLATVAEAVYAFFKNFRMFSLMLPAAHLRERDSIAWASSAFIKQCKKTFIFLGKQNKVLYPSLRE